MVTFVYFASFRRNVLSLFLDALTTSAQRVANAELQSFGIRHAVHHKTMWLHLQCSSAMWK